MGAHFHDWLSLALRWAHLITGIAWIGASFYFNWLENRLQRADPSEGMAGDLWAVHGGGFYYLQKFAVAPPTLPPELHWFKYEAYATWLTGLLLLCTVYYWDARAFLMNPDAPLDSTALAIGIGVASLVVSWIVYNLLCQALAGRSPLALALLVLGWFTALTWLLGEFFSARAAFIHVGAAIGTVMVANVAHVIIPAQRDLVAAVEEGRAADAAKGKAALLRSRHNNYLTLPVLFIMISAHYPGTYGHAQAWLVLLGISLSGVAIRHYFNIRHTDGPAGLFLAAGIALLAVTAVMTAPFAPSAPPGKVAARGPAISDAEAMAIIQQRCVSCHAQSPTQEGFQAPPLGIALESPADLERHRQRVYQSIAARTMPLGNLTRMTDEERRSIVNWHLDRN